MVGIRSSSNLQRVGPSITDEHTSQSNLWATATLARKRSLVTGARPNALLVFLIMSANFLAVSGPISLATATSKYSKYFSRFAALTTPKRLVTLNSTSFSAGMASMISLVERASNRTMRGMANLKAFPVKEE